ncbi:MAG: hypothetical protein QXJ17_01380 [Nitrososphaeria archaeon]
MNTSKSKVTSIIIANELTYMPLPNRFYSTTTESSVLEYVLDALWTIYDNILILTPIEPPIDILERINPVGARIIMGKGKSLPEMLSTALEFVETPVTVLVSGDRPLLKPNILFTVGYSINEYEIAIPRWKDKKVDPFLASYKTSVLKRLISKFKTQDDFYKLHDMLTDVLYLSVESELKTLDPELYSFIKLESPNDRERVVKIIDLK